jgi:hypothetical protein
MDLTLREILDKLLYEVNKIICVHNYYDLFYHNYFQQLQ